MRAWPFALSILLLSACDGGGGCSIDSDCGDFALVCLQRQCVPPGTVIFDSGTPELDAGRRRDAGGGGTDAGPMVDAGPDVFVPMCMDVSARWAISTVGGTCGSAAAGFISVVSSPMPCTYTAVTETGGMPAIDGSFTLDAANALVGTLNAGGTGDMACTGTGTTDTLLVTCGGCTLTFARAP